MKYTTLLFFLIPFLTSERSNFELPITGQNYPAAIEVFRLARMMNCEAMGEGTQGMVFCADAAKNRAKKHCKNLAQELESGFCLSDVPKPEILELARQIINCEPIHEYTYFLNPDKARNKRFLRWSKTRQNSILGQHYFFN